MYEDIHFWDIMEDKVVMSNLLKLNQKCHYGDVHSKFKSFST